MNGYKTSASLPLPRGHHHQGNTNSLRRSRTTELSIMNLRLQPGDRVRLRWCFTSASDCLSDQAHQGKEVMEKNIFPFFVEKKYEKLPFCQHRKNRKGHICKIKVQKFAFFFSICHTRLDELITVSLIEHFLSQRATRQISRKQTHVSC